MATVHLVNTIPARRPCWRRRCGSGSRGFVELEGKGDKFHVGYWFSVYDEAQAKALEPSAKSTFRRIHESLPK